MRFDFNMTLDHPRMRYIVRNAVRWHLTGFDAMNGRGMDADGVQEHGWSASERKRIAAIMADPEALNAVLVKWMEHDDAKPPHMQNESDKNDIAMMLMVDPFFSRGRPKQ
jgi:hypothetical protein